MARYQQSDADAALDRINAHKVRDRSHAGQRNRAKQRAHYRRHHCPFKAAGLRQEAKAWRTPQLSRYCVWRVIRANGQTTFVAGNEAGVACCAGAQKWIDQALRVERVLSCLPRRTARAVAMMIRRMAKSYPQNNLTVDAGTL